MKIIYLTILFIVTVLAVMAEAKPALGSDLVQTLNDV